MSCVTVSHLYLYDHIPPCFPATLSLTLFLHRATFQVTLSICLSSRLFVSLILRDGSNDGDNDDGDDYDYYRKDLLTKYDHEEGQNLWLLPQHPEPQRGIYRQTGNKTESRGAWPTGGVEN